MMETTTKQYKVTMLLKTTPPFPLLLIEAAQKHNQHYQASPRALNKAGKLLDFLRIAAASLDCSLCKYLPSYPRTSTLLQR